MKRLGRNDICPIHRRRDCCGRAEFSRYTRPRHELKFSVRHDGTRVYPDLREVSPPAVMRRKKDAMLRTDPTCCACGQKFAEYSDVELAHVYGKGAGAFKRDDRYVKLMHTRANRIQGSVDLESYLKNHWKPEHCL